MAGVNTMMAPVNNMMAPFTGRSSRNGTNNRRSSVRLTPITPDPADSMNSTNAVAPSTNSNAPQALTDSALLDTLRSSVATVELPPECYPSNSTTTTQPLSASSASANWMTDSVLSNMSMVNMSLTSISPTISHQQPPIDSIDMPMGTGVTGSTTRDPYGIFSSSTRNNNPFLNAPGVMDSATTSSSGGGGGRMASTNSRGSLSLSMMGNLPLDMKDLDMDGLLDSMDSMGFQGMMIDQ